VKMKLVAPPLYVLTTQTLDKAKGVEVRDMCRDCWACRPSLETTEADSRSKSTCTSSSGCSIPLQVESMREGT
jgi:translation initiation factor 2 subunit 1